MTPDEVEQLFDSLDLLTSEESQTLVNLINLQTETKPEAPDER